jgi:hypothetical protein
VCLLQIRGRSDLPAETSRGEVLDFGLKEGGFLVSRRPYTRRQMINKLRQAEVLQSR